MPLKTMAIISLFNMAQTPKVNIITKMIRYFCYDIVINNTLKKYIITKMVEQYQIELTIVP
jgi:hypothetical protein